MQKYLASFGLLAILAIAVAGGPTSAAPQAVSGTAPGSAPSATAPGTGLAGTGPTAARAGFQQTLRWTPQPEFDDGTDTDLLTVSPDLLEPSTSIQDGDVVPAAVGSPEGTTAAGTAAHESQNNDSQDNDEHDWLLALPVAFVVGVGGYVLIARRL